MAPHTSVKLPAQVAQMEAEAAKLLEEHQKATNSPAADQGTEPQTPANREEYFDPSTVNQPKQAQPVPPPPEEAPPPGAVPVPQPAPGFRQEAAPTPPPAAPMAPPAPAPQAVPMPEAKPDDQWEERYKTLQGKYDAEIPALHDRIRQLEEMVTQRGASQELAESAPVENAEPQEIYTEDDRSEYGELLDVTTKGANTIAQKAVEKATAPLREELAKIKTGKFYDALDRLVPNWSEINKQEGWLYWLSQNDPLTGTQRQQLLDNAFDNVDAHRAANFFEQYMRNVEAAQAEPTYATNPSDLAQQYAVPDTLPDVNEPPAQAPWYRESDIAQFFEDKARGVYAKDPQLCAELERTYELALSEGRVHRGQ